MCARWLAQGVGDVLATAAQAARDRHLTRMQVARCLSIGHPDDVDRHDCISIGPGGGGDRLHQRARVKGFGDFGSVIEIGLDQRDREVAVEVGKLNGEPVRPGFGDQELLRARRRSADVRRRGTEMKA
jgi:hypothetical protein